MSGQRRPDIRPGEKQVESGIMQLLDLVGNRPGVGPVRIDKFSQVRRTLCPRCGDSVLCQGCGGPGHLGTQQSPGILDLRASFVGASVRVWIEVKGRAGRLRAAQKEWLEHNIAAGALAAPAWSVEDAAYILVQAGIPHDKVTSTPLVHVSPETIAYVMTWREK